jgi:hypothetical protein
VLANRQPSDRRSSCPWRWECWWSRLPPPNPVCTKRSPLPHQADDTSTCERWRLATLLLLGSCCGECTGVAHVVPGGRDPAVGTLDVGDAELVDMAVEGVGDPARMSADARDCAAAATRRAAQADVVEDDADRGAVGAQPEATAPLSRRAVRSHDPRWEPGAVLSHAGICRERGEQSVPLPRRHVFNRLHTTLNLLDVA